LEKYCRAGQATDDNMVHAHYMLNPQGYKHTHSEYVILIAVTLQQWMHKHPSKMLCKHCLPF